MFINFANLVLVAFVAIFFTLSIGDRSSNGSSRRSYSKDNFSIDKNANNRSLTLIEAKGQLIKPGSNSNDRRFILLPKEVVRASVNGLNFPWHLRRVEDLTRLPNPSAKTILSTQSFID
jgi:hypothetical protein